MLLAVLPALLWKPNKRLKSIKRLKRKPSAKILGITGIFSESFDEITFYHHCLWQVGKGKTKSCAPDQGYPPPPAPAAPFRGGGRGGLFAAPTLVFFRGKERRRPVLIGSHTTFPLRSFNTQLVSWELDPDNVNVKSFSRFLGCWLPQSRCPC